MADRAKSLPDNVEGDFFVDSTCIDCGACRWIAPLTFGAAGGYANVTRQPEGDVARRRALQALTACPTGSIGTRDDKAGVRWAAASFPDRVIDGVYHCGFHSEDSFGAASWLVVREGGNVLVDSPRFHRGLVRRIEALGGVALMFLTHRDDVAEHARFAAHFGCRRVLHARDVTADTREVEKRIDGDEPVAIADDLVVVPTPGHTRGSACLLYEDRVLFSGDHAAWSASRQRVYAFRDACWYDWRTQTESMALLAEHRFEHLLPGHGAPCHLDAESMRLQIEQCARWMQDVA
jgi:glyoxylase-like metal-dependent hydrolase (beta-lactamase superfamily II)/ferredoxin